MGNLQDIEKLMNVSGVVVFKKIRIKKVYNKSVGVSFRLEIGHDAFNKPGKIQDMLMTRVKKCVHF